MSCILAAGMLFTSCNMSNTGKGALIGGGSGAAVGAGLGAIFGKGKGAAGPGRLSRWILHDHHGTLQLQAPHGYCPGAGAAAGRSGHHR